MSQDVAIPQSPASPDVFVRAGSLAIAALVLASGATGLAYEVLWSKYLGIVLGTGSYTHAVVLGTFLGGLAIGNSLIGKFADRSKEPSRPLYLYGCLELGIGAFGGVSPLAINWLFDLYALLLPGLDVSPSVLLACKIAISVAILLPPTVMMGGTLPVLCAFLTTRIALLQGSLARLYFLNSAGAAAGAILTGFYLIPLLGLDKTIGYTAFLNVGIGIAAMALSKRKRVDVRATWNPNGGQCESRVYEEKDIRLVWWAMLLAGFVTLSYEIAWIRLFSLVLGSSTYTFALLVGAFIAGIALGSLCIRRLRPGAHDPLLLLGLTQVAAATCVALAVPICERTPHFFIQLGGLINRTPENFIVWEGLKFSVCAVSMLLPTAFIGMSLPLACRIATRTKAEIGAAVGRVFSFNTVGNVLGATVSGLVLLPLLGIRGLIETATVLQVALGTVLIAHGPRLKIHQRVIVTAVPVFLLILGRIASPEWSRAMLASGVFRQRQPSPSSTFEAYRSQFLSHKLVYYRDDALCTVSVTKIDEVLRLHVNGKVDASSRGDLPTQTLLAHIPMVMRPNAKSVLVVGLGSGITAGSAALHPTSNVHVVEISPAVVDASRLFANHNGDVLRNPKVHVHVDDALSFLKRDRGRYDVIMSAPSNPWMANVGNLFSREFFESARDHLSPKGLFAAWLQSYEMDDSTFKLMLRTFAVVFESISLWHSKGGDIVLLGSRHPLKPDYGQMEARVAHASIGRDLSRIGLNGLPTLLALQMTGDGDSRTLAGVGEITTLRHSHVEYRAPIAFFTGVSAQVPFDGDARLKVLGRSASDMYLPDFIKWRGHALEAKEFANMVDYLYVQSWRPSLVRLFARAWAQQHPNDARAWLMVARIASKLGQTSEGLEALKRARSISPRDPEILSLMAALEFANYQERKSYLHSQTKRLNRIRGRLTDLLELLPESQSETYRQIAAIDLELGEFDAARKNFNRVIAIKSSQKIISNQDTCRLWLVAAKAAFDRDSPAWTLSFAREALRANPQSDRARRVVESLERNSGERPRSLGFDH